MITDQDPWTFPPAILAGLQYELSAAYDAPVGLSGANRRDFHDSCVACWYLHEGAVTVRWSEGSFVGRPGQWVLSEPSVRRTQTFRPGTRILSVRFTLRWGAQEHFRLPGQPLLLDAAAAPSLLPLARNLLAVLHRPTSASADEAWRQQPIPAAQHAERVARLHAFIAAWHGVLADHGVAAQGWEITEPRLRPVLDRLAADDGLGPLPYTELCEAAGLSRPQLDRLFRRELGVTPRAWQERRCLGAAERLLRQGERSVKEIAARLRFTDGSHFAKWFRRQTGYAPGARRTEW